ncbi:hypothetical protein NPIL_531221 [Nephila pilipes]|uniref:Uncharacterized protein n=1 Tax=Nephila pilipes TaxID=299642 RepID=A0A8X6NER9_NEPPI|nr:hypothetical protein NPIL_531221 [Nephila pilipes]
MVPFSSTTYGKCLRQLDMAYSLSSESMFVEIYSEIKQAYKNGVPSSAEITDSRYCDSYKDSLLPDRIVLGINDIRLQELLRRERELTLDKYIDFKGAAEYASMKGKEIHLVICEIKSSSESHKHLSDTGKELNKQWYRFCGKLNKFKKEFCLVWGKSVCSKCGSNNHFAKVCSKKMLKPSKVHELNDNIVKVWINNVKNKTTDDILCVKLINKKKGHFQIDIKTSVNILGK